MNMLVYKLKQLIQQDTSVPTMLLQLIVKLRHTVLNDIMTVYLSLVQRRYETTTGQTLQALIELIALTFL